MKQFLLTFFILLHFACGNQFPAVYPVLETEPVKNRDDAADDMAIFIHPDNPGVMAIIGTNKQAGLNVYDHTGRAVHEYLFGRINNVDLRQRVPWNGEKITLVGGSNRSDNSLVFYRLDEKTLELKPLHQQPIPSSVNEVYGFCLYLSDACYAFVVGKDGVLEQWRLDAKADGSLSASMVRSFDTGDQSEGLVADDELGYLYIGEEDRGIWKYSARPDADSSRTTVDLVKENPQLKADVEGLTIYYKTGGEGYLIASSQGNNSYAVYERQGNNRYLGSFKIAASDAIGGTAETDGIDVTSLPFGPYPKGIFVAQDGKNGKANQNFKIVDFRDIEHLFSSRPPGSLSQKEAVSK
ncbi:MAG: phytase [Lewinellaceae bacterium]|nr:phytase [Saprospiraceae bacterium]MCB9340036.1 phytase [Lewinellaceae bacterium]